MFHKCLSQSRSTGSVHHLLHSSSRSVSGVALPRVFGIRERYLESERARAVANDKLLDKLRAKEPVKVTVTGAAGAIGYAALFRIANGELLGPDQPVHLSCLELPPAMDALKGVMMELEDCAFPNLESLQGTDDANRAFDGCEIAMFIGSKPRGPGMERADLLKDNGMIFQALGNALNKNAARHCRSVVVGNPCNTNCLILANNAPDLDRKNFTAMTRLDHDRGIAQIAHYFSLPSNVINYFAIWGNHSPTMFPDLTATTVHGVPFHEAFGEMKYDRYYRFEFTPKVQQRGARVIAVRGASSAASAANASIAHTRDWCLGTPQPDWTSMAVVSQGDYGVPEGLVFSYPVWCKEGQYSLVSVPYALDDYSQYMIEKNIEELVAERDAVSHLLPN